MKHLIQPVVIAVLSLYSCAAQTVTPRADVTQYPHQAVGKEVELGAEVLDHRAVSQRFTTDLNRGYLVIELGVFPKGTSLGLRLGDFILKFQGGTTMRAGSPKAVSRVLKESAPTETSVTVVPEVGVSYEAGTGTPPEYPDYDPSDQRYPRRGLGTRVGIGIGISNDQPGSTEQDRQVMEIELKEKGLPEGPTSAPVAGYLYFHIQDPLTQSSCVLVYSGSSESVSLALQIP